MKILDLSAGNRAVWFNKSHPDAIYVDVRHEVAPSIVADARALPAEVGEGFDLILFDPPHKNNAATGKMARNYGHWTAEQIKDIVIGSAKEAHRVARADALMAFKWNDHTRKLSSVLPWISEWWEPLFGHGMAPQQRGRSTTSWVMLRRRGAQQFSLTHYSRGRAVSQTHRIMYVCTICSDMYPEGCGHYDRAELRVMPDGRWLCECCYDDCPPDRSDPDATRIPFVSLPPPPEYGPKAELLSSGEREKS